MPSVEYFCTAWSLEGLPSASASMIGVVCLVGWVVFMVAQIDWYMDLNFLSSFEALDSMCAQGHSK